MWNLRSCFIDKDWVVNLIEHFSPFCIQRYQLTTLSWILVRSIALGGQMHSESDISFDQASVNLLTMQEVGGGSGFSDQIMACHAFWTFNGEVGIP